MTALRLHEQVLPRPGPVWGSYPLRRADERVPPWRGWAALRPASHAAGTIARLAQAAVPRWAGLSDAAQADALLALRRRLRREGLVPAAAAEALAAAGVAASRTLGLAPRPGQWLAAAALIDARWVEMATGEGKTLALALAAASGALAGLPVHAVTANDYLAARDASRLGPLYAALGLRVAAAVSAEESDRREAYRADVVYATAKTLAFDHLRDEEGLARGEPPRLRGLCLALLDELDSILLDEAQVPLVLARPAPQPARRALLWQACAIARPLRPDLHFTVDAAARQARLTAAGEEAAAERAAPLGGPWRHARLRREAVTLALTGLHALQRNRHYVVRHGVVELLDEVTGRAAAGRQWSRGLQTVVALKEGLAPPAETETMARMTFQRFFQRYWRLAGLSGTVQEARSELRRTYGLGLLRVPLHAPSRRVDGPLRAFDDPEARWNAAVARVGALRAQGRPVLVGTDGVDDSEALSARLAAAGIAHRVLHALNDAQEAAIVAGAGAAGCVTVATRMAGRGTDIELDVAARAAGGLHVLNCQHNPSARQDRQLLGRAARQGDPGSTETWLLLPCLADGDGRSSPTLAGWIDRRLPVPLRPAWLRLRHRLHQALEERRRAAHRGELLRQDADWETRLPSASPWR